ncbi:alkyl hydroperoxide reductase [Moesziomyces antarcticus T-34]|uniref:thioredoxin-dependent peroxiredoxin n=1 Tax=Pseudozyma antarctica (strain T-34) TaxID=1151754 RepID=M9MED6_PSEA3|nr:alkyl hydroperoxide reductase [Moesziomyces antarcticus T-34]
MPHLPRVPAFPIAGERSLLTAAGAALKIPAKEKDSPLIGHFAPEIIATDHLGRTVSLHATIALGRPIVLYFFPLAGSPHCTKESCSFRDAVGASPIFNDLNAVVIGISQDPPARSRRFVDEHHLGFRILHDSQRHIMDAWGVGRGLLGLIDGRCTFVIDHQGVVRAMLDGVWDYQGHRNFAEKWLCRIEHELSGRERFYIAHDDEGVACEEANVKVVYGDPVPGRGIAAAPRHGAAPSAKSSLKSLKPTATSLQDEQSMGRARSRRNLKAWLRPNASYDEPLQVEAVSAPARGEEETRSVDGVAARVRSLRLDEEAKEQECPRSRRGSGSGSGWATSSTISARSISTGETSHTSPAPAEPAALLAALKDGVEGERVRRRVDSATPSIVGRSSSLRSQEVFANGNIARMPLTGSSDTRPRRDVSADTTFSSSSLPVPPRPAARLVGGVVAAAAEARLDASRYDAALPSSPIEPGSTDAPRLRKPASPARTRGMPSPSTSGANFVWTERRLSNTPSLAASTASVCERSEYEYSPSLAESTHTFGGLDE